MINPFDWVPSSGFMLEPNARMAVMKRTGSQVIMAGPGAGKTELLAQRADFLLSTGISSFPKRILAISFKRDASENLKERVKNRCGSQLASRFDSYTFHAFSKKIIDIFRTSLVGDNELNENYTIGKNKVFPNQVTFDDLVNLANRILLDCSLARTSVLSTYSDIFLDEFQDCTASQYALIKSAFHGHDLRLIAVGDTKQKIMGWAGALEGIFINFKNDFNATPLNLYQNFRSKLRIRRVINAMVRDLDPTAALDDDDLVGEEGVVLIENFSSDQSEAKWIANYIGCRVEEGIPLAEIAILCSSQPLLYAGMIMEELEHRKVPYRNEQEMQDLSCEPLFKLILDYLMVLLGSSEADSWVRLFSVLAPDNYDDVDAAGARNWNNYIEEKRILVKGKLKFEQIWSAVEEFLQIIDRDVILSLSPDYENILHVEQLVCSTKDQISQCFSGSNEIIKSLKRLIYVDAVRILTIHKSKGLEFKSVIILGVEQETFFGTESDCAFFVAVSRAKEHLVVTTCKQRSKPEGANSYWKINRSAHSKYLSFVSSHVGGAI